MISKISPGAKYPIAGVYLYNNNFFIEKFVLYKNMFIFKELFKTQSDQNIHQTAPIFFGELVYAPEPPSIYLQL